MTPAQKAYLANRWGEAALAEHASVAAFSRFVLQLMGLGAPPRMLQQALDAAKDEVGHAQACFAIAGRFMGEPVGPGPLLLAPTLWRTEQPLKVMQDAIFEGCVAETVAAYSARAALEATADQPIRAVLCGIVEDEFRHSDFSWTFVAWMLDRYPAMVEPARAFFARALESLPPSVAAHPHFVAGYGLLDGSELHRSEQDAVTELVLPRYRKLFGESLAVRRGAGPHSESLVL